MQRREPVGPEGPEAVEPLIDLFQRRGVYGVKPPRPLGSHGRKSRVPQYLEVLADRRLGDAELLLDNRDDLARGMLAPRQHLEDAAADRIAEDVERVHHISGGGISPV